MSQTAKNKNANPSPQSKGQFVFQKINYLIFISSIIVVAFGFILMMGTEDIYSFTKITLAPLIVVIGFAIGFVAILYKPKKKAGQE